MVRDGDCRSRHAARRVCSKAALIHDLTPREKNRKSRWSSFEDDARGRGLTYVKTVYNRQIGFPRLAVRCGGPARGSREKRALETKL